MEPGTFDLTAAPTTQAPKPLPKVNNEVKTVTVSMGPKKDINTSQGKPTQSVSKLPNLAQQPVALSASKNNQQSSKSLPKPTKIEVFRNVIDQVQQQQTITNKKDKKQVPVGTQSTKVLKEAYAKQVIESVNRLYERPQEDQLHIAYELKQLEKKRNVQLELEKKEQQMNREKNEHDQILYDIKQKQKKIQHLDAIINSLDNVFAKDEDITVLQEKEMEVEVISESIRQAQHESSILQHMFETRRKILLFVQKQCKEAYDELAIHNQKLNIAVSSQTLRESNIQMLSKMIQKYRIQNSEGNNIWGSVWKSNFNADLQNMLEDELSLFEDRKMLNEVIGHERQIEEEKEKEILDQQKQAILRAKKEREQAQQKAREDKKKIENMLNEKKKMFEKLRKVTRVSELEKIIPHKNDLEAGFAQLKHIEEMLERDLEKHQQQIQDLNQNLKVLQFQTGAEDDANQMKIDDLERDLMKEFDLLSDKEKQLKRAEKSIDEVTVAMSRIMYQLQGKGTKSTNIEIKRDKLVSTASVVSLRLERMLTVLSKKKEFLNEESVNTNPRYFKVPDFIGLNSKTYAEMEGKDFIETDVFVYKEDDSLDEEMQMMDRNRLLVKTNKDKEEELRELERERQNEMERQKEKEKEKLIKKDKKK